MWIMSDNIKLLKWFFPEEQMPKIGDRIIVSDGNEQMEIIFEALPADVRQSNVRMWRYAE